MGSFFRTLVLFLVAVLAALPLPTAAAQESRSGTIDVYLLVDGSSSFGEKRAEALDWTASEVLGGLLRDGDRVTLWSVDAQPRLLFKGTIAGSGDLAQAEALLRSAPASAGKADYAAALRAAAAEEARRTDRTPIAFALLVCGSSGPGAASDGGDGELSRLLRFSRVDDHPGWRSIVVGLGLEDQAKSAAAAYMLLHGNGSAAAP